MSRILTLVALFLSLSTAPAANEGLGIPGTTQTDTGYDTELGKDSVCWKSHNYLEDPTIGQHTYFPNPLIPSFQLGGSVKLLTSCPMHLNVSVFAPTEFTTNKDIVGWKPRTKTEYNFTISGTINLNELEGDTLVSDFGSTILVQIILCRLGSSGFCSPFVHEQSNARNAAAGITTPPAKGDLHGGTHVHSEKIFVKMEPNVMNHEFTMEVPFIVNVPAEFFAIGAAQFFVGDVAGEPFFRYDVANKADIDIIAFADPPTILTVRPAIEIAIITMIGVGCAAIFGLIVFTLRYRATQIMQLSQPSSLLILLVASLVSCACTWMLMPHVSDTACKTYSFFIYVPLNVVYATLLARIWRARAILSPLLQGFYNSDLTSTFAKVVGKLTCSQPKTSSVQAGTVTGWQMASVIAVLSAPQFVIQMLAMILQPRNIVTIYNEDASIGHQACSSGINRWVSLETWGFYMILFMNIILIILAESNQRLPSLFDEVKVISSIAFINAVGLFFATSIIALASGAEDNPEIFLITMSLSIVCITLTCSLRLVLPKLMMIWKRQTVVVSKLVSNHATEKKANHRSSKRRPVGIYSEMSRAEASDIESIPDFTTLEESSGDSSSASPEQQRSINRADAGEIVIADESTPSRTLVVPMLQLQEKLIGINTKVTSGMRVDRDEWGELRNLMRDLGDTFSNDVTFEWEHNELSRSRVPGHDERYA